MLMPLPDPEIIKNGPSASPDAETSGTCIYAAFSAFLANWLSLRDVCPLIGSQELVVAQLVVVDGPRARCVWSTQRACTVGPALQRLEVLGCTDLDQYFSPCAAAEWSS